jgi:DNA-binding NarL/FixJ family response regulator
VERAVDYSDALTKIAEKQYDMYVVDIILPSGEQAITKEQVKEKLLRVEDIFYGIELIRHIRSIGLNQPILVVTVVTEQDKIARIKEIDQSIGFVLKYYATPDDVKEAVDELLQG